LILPTLCQEATISWSAFVVRLSDRFTSIDRDLVVNTLHRHDIGAANYFPCAALLPHVRALVNTQPGDFPVAESLSSRTLALPLSDRMTADEVELVAQVLEVALARLTVTRD